MLGWVVAKVSDIHTTTTSAADTAEKEGEMNDTYTPMTDEEWEQRKAASDAVFAELDQQIADINEQIAEARARRERTWRRVLLFDWFTVYALGLLTIVLWTLIAPLAGIAASLVLASIWAWSFSKTI